MDTGKADMLGSGDKQLEGLEEAGGAKRLEGDTPGKGSSSCADGVPPPRAQGTVAWIASPPLTRIITFGRRIHTEALARYEETYPRVLDTLRRVLKLCGLTLMIIFVVMLASWFMALSHWFTVFFGHFVLRYTFPQFLDDAFAKKNLDFTAIFAAIGALVVNLPPFLIFLLSVPLTFDRTVLEGSAAPANDFIKRITPNNWYALMFLKYAPRLSAGPVGCAIYWLLTGPDEVEDTLDPLHAAIAGAAGELVLSILGYVKNRLKRRPVGGEPITKDTLPM
ncbi:hypothetical protein BD311DRAFT_687137 [Dichomitus squalens]|uniref:Uncharacterized protein n=1 Tax=Dichomitus squalens TaxID=114155 RepID=A0A4Q9MW85_9APHY|nr:hypothetical protein BD311DRAFT_687137 [Dichomitus squalens]